MLGRSRTLRKVKDDEASQELARRAFANDLIGTGLMGTYIARWAFLAFPPLKYVVSEDNPRFARVLLRFTRAFNAATGHTLSQGAGAFADLVDSSLIQVQALAANHGATRYRDIAVFYGQSLGFMPLLVRRDGVDWVRVEEVEAQAFAGGFRTLKWWPEGSHTQAATS